MAQITVDYPVTGKVITLDVIQVDGSTRELAISTTEPYPTHYLGSCATIQEGDIVKVKVAGVLVGGDKYEIMRGTDNANIVVPDAAGTASSLHTITNGLITALNDVTANDVIIALMNEDDVTEGGTWTFRKSIKIINAFAAGLWRDGDGVKELLDPDDGTTVILEATISESSPYVQTTVLI